MFPPAEITRMLLGPEESTLWLMDVMFSRTTLDFENVIFIKLLKSATPEALEYFARNPPFIRLVEALEKPYFRELLKLIPSSVLDSYFLGVTNSNKFLNGMLTQPKETVCIVL